jgi:hypothetical protein
MMIDFYELYWIIMNYIVGWLGEDRELLWTILQEDEKMIIIMNYIAGGLDDDYYELYCRMVRGR